MSICSVKIVVLKPCGGFQRSFYILFVLSPHAFTVRHHVRHLDLLL